MRVREIVDSCLFLDGLLLMLCAALGVPIAIAWGIWIADKATIMYGIAVAAATFVVGSKMTEAINKYKD